METLVSEYEHCKELLAKAKVNERTGCMIYNGTVNPRGYCELWIKGKKWLVHRFVAIHNIKRSERVANKLATFQVHQTCGLTVCINPEHLEFSTNRQKLDPEYEELVKWWEPGASYSRQ